jgi:thioredoxin-like negative regulator of GroEL
MPAVEQHGDLTKVSFAHVNTDRERELANQLMAGNMIPQLIMYTKTADGWKVDRMIGAQSPEAVEEFLNKAIPTATLASVGKDKSVDTAN